MRKILLLLIYMSQFTFSQVPSYIPSNGLVGYWPFNGNANDESGNGNNGINSGATLTTDRFGSINSAYSFNGTSNEISITNSLLNLVSDFTISCWMNSTDIAKIQQSIFNSINHTGFIVELNNENIPANKLMVGVGPANAFWNLIYAQGTYNQFQNNIWYHIVFVKSGTIYSLYQNNQLDGSYVVSGSTGYNQSVGIRFGSIGGAGFFKGKLDDFGVWSRALNTQEITTLYTATPLSINQFLNESLTIYPNPSKNLLTIDLGTNSNVIGGNYKLVNTLGQEVLNGVFSSQQSSIELNNIKGEGIYFVKIYDSSNNLLGTKNIIIQK